MSEEERARLNACMEALMKSHQPSDETAARVYRSVTAAVEKEEAAWAELAPGWEAYRLVAGIHQRAFAIFGRFWPYTDAS